MQYHSASDCILTIANNGTQLTNHTHTMKNVTKQDIENMIMDLLMAQGFFAEKGKGFKEKGMKHLDALYLELHRLKDTL